MRCAWCSSSIGPLSRGDSRYCSGRCRVAAHRAAPPSTLRAIDRWVRWTATKVPLTPTGKNASSTNSSTWSSYAEVADSTVGVGIGFVLSDVDRIVCVDLDHCLDGRGHPEPWAARMLTTVPATYIEVSPSGHGLHVWGLGDITKGRRNGNVEVYGTGRYLTVTGRRWRHAGASFAELGNWIDSL